MRDQWLAIEHYRLHAVEEWPDSPRKEAALAAIHSKLKSLTRDQAQSSIECTICLDRINKLVEFPHSLPALVRIDAAA